MKKGDTVYLFDENRRVYRVDNSAPVYEEHFIPIRIESETPTEYICDHGKINKRSGMFRYNPKYKPQRVYTEQEREDKIWLNVHRYKLLREVETADVLILRQIAQLVGYNGSEV